MVIIASQIAEKKFGKEPLMELAISVTGGNQNMIDEEVAFDCHCVMEGENGPIEMLVWVGFHKNKYTMLIRMSSELEVDMEG